MYTIIQEKLKLRLYNENRYLYANLPDSNPNLNIHAYGHCKLLTRKHLITDQPEIGAKLKIWHRDALGQTIRARDQAPRTS